MLIISLLSGTALAGSADGVDHELSLVSNAMVSRDDTWDVFSDSNMVNSLGFRGGYALSPNLSVVGGWSRGRYDSSIDVDVDGSYDYFGFDFTTNQITLGPKVDIQVTHWLRPYATVQGLANLGRLRLDSDPGDDDDELLRYRDLSFGGLATGGVELVPGTSSNRLHVGVFLEMGYGRVFALSFEDTDAGNTAIPLGDLDMQGLSVNSGVGVRF